METGTKTPATTTDTYEEPHPLAEAGERAGESVGQLAERATNLGLTQADRGKDQAAQGISQVAQPTIANASRTAADQAERLAAYLQQTDAREIVHTVEDAARRQPLIFLGGAFILGLAAARFMKAAGGTTRTAYRSGYSNTYGSASTHAGGNRASGTSQGI
jgi:hypothetical protein